MSKFEGRLLDDLLREHGSKLANDVAPMHRKHQMTVRRRAILAAAGAVAVAAAAAGTLAASTGNSAYAVTTKPNGAIELAVYQKSGIAGINALLRELGDDQVVVVPVEPGCPSIGSLPPPPVSAKGRMISMQTSRSSNGSVTVNAQGVPAGDIVVVGMVRSGGSSYAGSALTSAPAPSCVTLNSPPPPGH